MPYNPGVQYEGAKYIYSGLTNAGDRIAEGMGEMYRKREEADFFRQKIDDLGKFIDPTTNQPLIDPETASKLYGASTSAQKAAVADAVFKLDHGLKEREFKTREGWRGDASARGWANYYLDVEQQRPFQPPAEAIEAAKAAGYLYLPQSRSGGSYVPASRAGLDAAPQIYDLGGVKVIQDGKGRVQQVRTGAGARPLDAGDAAILGASQERLAKLNQEIAEHSAAISRGDKRTGFLNFSSRESRLRDLEAEKAGLEAKIGAMRRPVAAPSTAPAAVPAAAPSGMPVVEPPLPTRDEPAARTAMGGYQVGRKYAGKTYLGGDPNDAANWR